MKKKISKNCYLCRKKKDIKDFYKEKTRDVYSSRCIECSKKYSKKWSSKNVLLLQIPIKKIGKGFFKKKTKIGILSINILNK